MVLERYPPLLGGPLGEEAVFLAFLHVTLNAFDWCPEGVWWGGVVARFVVGISWVGTISGLMSQARS